MAEVVNPIPKELLPRLNKEFVELYNENAATRVASHQVPIEEVGIKVGLLMTGSCPS
jgi:hypothetical protein